MSPLLKRHILENLPCPLAKRGSSSLLQSLPVGRGGKEGLEG